MIDDPELIALLAITKDEIFEITIKDEKVIGLFRSHEDLKKYLDEIEQTILENFRQGNLFHKKYTVSIFNYLWENLLDNKKDQLGS